MRVLLVEDDAAMAKSIETMLKGQSYACDVVDCAEDALDLARLYEYDILILDLMLPDSDGYAVLRHLRNAGIRTPVVILSGLSGMDERIKGLNQGADDYLTKPVDNRELLARLQTIVRRSRGHSQSVIQTGKIRLNLNARTVHVDGRFVHMTPREYGLLELLSLRKGYSLTKETMLDHLYVDMDEPQPKIIDVFVCKLRQKIANATGGDSYIHTVWGHGYMLCDPEADFSGETPGTLHQTPAEGPALASSV